MRNAILLLALLCAACSTNTASLPTIRPYHMDIQQGNVVTNKMMLQLKPGMTKSQVRFVMGTPLISDSFHADRWDYFYSMKKDGHLIEQRRVILDFESDKLKRVRGDVIPAGSAGDAASEQDKKAAAPKSIWENKPAAPKEDKGWLDKLKFWGDDKKPEVKLAPMPEPKPEVTLPPQPASAAAPRQEEKKGLLDKLKFWVDDNKTEVKPAPEVKPEPKLEPKPAPVPVARPQPVAAPADKPVADKEEKKGLLDKLKFWGDDKKAAPEVEAIPVKPAPTPVAKPKPEVKVEEAKPQEAHPKSAPVAETAEKPVPKPVDLPPETDPSYFERMLEKIGF